MKHTRRRSKKTISKKFGGGLLLFLSGISLIGVGFSSWLIGPLSSAQVDINVYAADIISGDYFSISTNDIKMFTLGPSGLVKDETIVNESSIEISFYINNEVAYPSTGSGLLSFEMILSCSSQLFLNTYISSPTMTGATNLSSSTSDAGIVSNASYAISETGKTKVTTIYKVTDTANADGKYMADLYYSAKPTFNFKVRGK